MDNCEVKHCVNCTFIQFVCVGYCYFAIELIFYSRFKLVFVLDLKRLTGTSLAQAIQEQCLSGARSISEIHYDQSSSERSTLYYGRL